MAFTWPLVLDGRPRFFGGKFRCGLGANRPTPFASASIGVVKTRLNTMRAA
jgi:hypothetical protein